MNNLRIRFISVAFLCFLNFTSLGQVINITPGQAAMTLAQKLAGPGITITSATLTCPSSANGIFRAFGSNLGIDSGIILTTGQALTVGATTGANGAATLFSDNDNNANGDVQLNAYIGNTTFNACALEFDFRPAGDTVKFDYCFGSEEYTNWSCSNFNDVFAFFISGPGIIGSQNLALIPNTTIPVAINSTTDTNQVIPVQPSLCTAMGPGSPFAQYYAGARTGATYDGFTTVLRAISKVFVCSTYHLKLIIADVGDGRLDSGVWLKAGSLSSNTARISASGAGAGTGVPYCVRNCYPGKFTIFRQDTLSSAVTVKYIILGDAINGVDYTFIPDSVVIPAGGVQTTVNIIPLTATPPTGKKVVKIYVLAPNCNPGGPPSYSDSAIIEILDELKLNILTPDTAICFGDEVQIRAEGDQAYTYSWLPFHGVNNTTIVNPLIKPDTTTEYTLKASYFLCPDVFKTIKIEVQPVPKIDIGKDTTICEWDSLHLNAKVTPDWYKNYSYSWDPNPDLSPLNVINPVFVGNQKASLYLTAKTSIGCTSTDTINIDIHPGNFGIAPPEGSGVCPLDSVILVAGGGEKYLWTPNVYLTKDTGDTVKSFPPAGLIYTIYVTDKYGCKDTVSVNVGIFAAAVLDLGDDIYLHPGEKYQMDAKGNCLSFQWFPYVGLSAVNIGNPVASPDVYTRYFVKGTTKDGCVAGDTIDVYRKGTELDVPNAFTPYGLNHNLKIVKRGIATLNYFRIFNRWGQKVFETNDINKGWDGRFNDVDQPYGVYVYSIDAIMDDGRRYVKQGNVTLIR